MDSATVMILEKKNDELRIKVLNVRGEVLLDITVQRKLYKEMKATGIIYNPVAFILIIRNIACTDFDNVLIFYI